MADLLCRIRLVWHRPSQANYHADLPFLLLIKAPKPDLRAGLQPGPSSSERPGSAWPTGCRQHRSHPFRALAKVGGS